MIKPKVRSVMAKFILGEKLGSTQIFQDNKIIPVSVIQTRPCLVTGVKTKTNGVGYSAVQLGFGDKKKIKKPILGQVKKLGRFKLIREFRLSDQSEMGDYKIGDDVKADIFLVGEKVNVSSVSKAKGFQGVVKRHGFRDAPRTHGQGTKYRHPGSIGATTPQRVIKGKKMAGRMGGERVTVRNLEVVEIDPENNLIMVRGAIPGHRNSLVEIRNASLTNHGRERLSKKIKINPRA